MMSKPKYIVVSESYSITESFPAARLYHKYYREQLPSPPRPPSPPPHPAIGLESCSNLRGDGVGRAKEEKSTQSFTLSSDFILNIQNVVRKTHTTSCCDLQEQEGKPSETDSIKFKIISKTPRGNKDSTKRHHHRHHKRQPGEQ